MCPHDDGIGEMKMTGGLKNQNLIGSHVYHNRLKGPLVHWFIAYQGYTMYVGGDPSFCVVKMLSGGET